MEKVIKKLAEEHALKVLGEEQFKVNKSAKKAIADDFKAGFNACLQLKYEMIKKGDKWDKLDEAMAMLYEQMDKMEEEGEECDGLISVGELAARHLGYGI